MSLEDCRITGLRQISATAFELWLKGPEIAAKSRPGQFVGIKCGEEMVLRRPFGIAELSDTEICVVFELRGKGTRWLSQRKPGENLSVLGALGNGFFPGNNGKILLAAGGIGAAPLLFAASMLGKQADAALGFRTKDAAILVEKFILKCEKTIVASDDGTIGEAGFVHQICEKMIAENRYEQILTCGPVKMMKAVAEVAQRNNIPCQVSLEERMGCGVGACLVCACKIKDKNGFKYAHVCKDGPVFDAKEVDWND